MATHVVVPVESLVKIPDHVDDDAAVFAVPVSRAIQAARQATIQGQTSQLYDSKDQYEEQIKKELYDVEQQGKMTHKQRNQMDGEIKHLSD